jgi:hypothetical protein
MHEILKKKPFGEQCVYKEFPEMVHGWVPRADFDDAANKRDHDLALEMSLDFFKKHCL